MGAATVLKIKLTDVHLPRRSVLHHYIENREQPSHARRQCQLLRLPGLTQVLIEGVTQDKGISSCLVRIGFRDETVEMSTAVPHDYGLSGTSRDPLIYLGCVFTSPVATGFACSAERVRTVRHSVSIGPTPRSTAGCH